MAGHDKGGRPACAGTAPPAALTALLDRRAEPLLAVERVVVGAQRQAVAAGGQAAGPQLLQPLQARGGAGAALRAARRHLRIRNSRAGELVVAAQHPS